MSPGIVVVTPYYRELVDALRRRQENVVAQARLAADRGSRELFVSHVGPHRRLPTEHDG